MFSWLQKTEKKTLNTLFSGQTHLKPFGHVYSQPITPPISIFAQDMNFRHDNGCGKLPWSKHSIAPASCMITFTCGNDEKLSSWDGSESFVMEEGWNMKQLGRKFLPLTLISQLHCHHHHNNRNLTLAEKLFLALAYLCWLAPFFHSNLNWYWARRMNLIVFVCVYGHVMVVQWTQQPIQFLVRALHFVRLSSILAVAMISMLENMLQKYWRKLCKIIGEHSETISKIHWKC